MAQETGTGDMVRDSALATHVDDMNGRLREIAVRVGEAVETLSRGDSGLVLDLLIDVEPLILEVQRIVSRIFILALKWDQNSK